MRIRQWIGKYFHAPILEDENDTRTVRILFHICSALVVGLGAILLLRVAFMQFELVFPIALMAISAGLTIVLISRKYVTAAKHFFLLTLLSFLLFLVFKSDGIHDTALLAFPGLLVIASILLVRSAYVIFTGVVLASVALLGYLEIAHSIVTPFSWRTNIFDVTDVLVILGVTAVTIRLLADGLFQTLAKIRQNQLDLKNRAEDLRESNERFARLADASFEGIVVSDNGIIVDLNNQLADMLGYTQSEMIGRSVVDFVPPQDVVQVVSPVRSNDEEPYEQCALRKDGSVLPVEIHAKSTFMGNHPVRVSAIRDISEQKRAEIEKKQMQAQILQTQKIDSIGTLAAGIAHDFNNLLNIIIGNSDLIDARPSDVAKVAQRNDAIRGAAQRGAKLVRQLLTFARKTKIELRPVLLNTIVMDTVRLMQETFPKTIEISVATPGHLPVIEGDINQLHQLLLNLCVNARDAMGEKGTLSISIETISGSSLLHKSAKVTSDVYVALSVRDTGSGMNDETLKRMFDPFFTTKEVGKGTGLGLAVVMGIVDSHGATIDVESTVGRGTAFHVYFPAIEAVASDAAEKKENLDAVRGGEGLILFVEDEESVREFVVEVLQGKGFQIVVAVDGEEAIRIFEKRSNEIALVLSDMGLPKLNGEEVFRRVRTIRPEVPFILATGYIDPKNRSRLMDIGIKDILMKPYRLADLVNHINAAVPAE